MADQLIITTFSPLTAILSVVIDFCWLLLDYCFLILSINLQSIIGIVVPFMVTCWSGDFSALALPKSRRQDQAGEGGGGTFFILQVYERVGIS